MNPRTKRACQSCGAHNVWDRVLYLDEHGEVTTYPARVVEMESIICLSCKHLQTLGPSDETDERVALEIDAASRAQEYADQNYKPGVDRYEYCPKTGSDELCDMCQAIMLAAEIAHHIVEHQRAGT